MRPNDPNARRDAIKLVQYLHFIAASTRADSCDLSEFEDRWWLSELPPGVRLRSEPAADGVLLTVDHVPPPAPPVLPPELNGHLDRRAWQDDDVSEVELSEELAARVAEPEPGTGLAAAYREAVAERERWLAEVEEGRTQRQLYEQLLEISTRLAAQDDEYELLLCSGLVSGEHESGQRVYRHLIVKRMFARIGDGHTKVVVGPADDAPLSMEDRRFLAPLLGERLGRADEIRADIESSDLLPTDEGVGKWLGDWSGRMLPDAPRYSDAAEPVPADRAGGLAVSASPALLLRRRDRSSVAGFLEEVLTKLRDPQTTVPLALVQILHDLTPEQQDEWMATAGHRKLLGEHPLFVKPYNREQRLVLDRVRQDNGAVVQGPPGTGKTHTIANLLVAMLAEGLRVLVVSQREHPLRVVRSMLPPELQNMCVSLAGGKRGRTSALEACVRAMSEYLASTTDEQAAARVESCRERWNSARQAVSDAEAALAVSRESEYTEHPPVAPGYHGRLAEIASAVQERRSEFGWLPSLPASASATCPLGALELAQLLALLRAHPDGPRRADQSVPPVEHVHDPAQIAQLFRDLEAPEVAPRVRDIADRCAGAGPAELDEWLKDLDRLREILRHLGERARSSGERWLVVAVGDLLAGQNLNAWRELVERDPSAERLSARSRNPVLRDVGFPGADPAALRELREEAEALARGLRDGQPVRTRVFRSLTGLGRETAHVREHCTYRQREPKTAESAAAVWDLLDILATLTDLEHAWSFVVPLEAPPADPGLRLRWLAQAEAVLPMLGELGNIAIRLRYRLAQKQILAVLTTEESWLVFRDGVALARARIDLAANEEFHAKLLTWWEHIASAADAAPELKTVTDALRDRDINAFRTAVAGVEQARATIESHRQLRELAGRLDDAHPEFLAELKASGQDERWGERCAAAEEAWTWAAAERFVRGQYRPGLDAEQEAALVAAKKELRSAAEELATAQAWASCLSTMDSSARRALRSYPYYAQRQGGQGKHAAQHRKSARSAISEAMPAVPAWVMPIDKVAELLQAEQNSFDVVIVDEASQASPTSLFLLWLAPRVIVVGDDKQCMPYSSTRGLESVSERLKGDFPDAPDHVREMLLPNGNLYDILSTAFPSVVRLREHFRCMPEIISWSSKEFYDGALVPLRQHGADRLEPVQIRFVPNGQAAGSSDTLVNRAEAEHVVDLLSERLADPAYDGKSFGVIAMQSPKQVKVLDQLIQKRIPASEIDARDIRAGSAQSFQGDERDVMVLSTVAAGRTQTLRDHSSYDRRLNVAASRAKDQLVIVTSLGEDLDPEDIRHRMFSHYQELEDTPLEVLDISRMSPEWLAAPFRSLFVQRVYLAVRSRGYDADAGVDIGGRTLDIVVHGRERSVAVICDEYRGLSAERRHRDDESLRELSRAGWPFCRVVHSQFVLDPDEALDVVWAALDAEQIEAAEA